LEKRREKRIKYCPFLGSERGFLKKLLYGRIWESERDKAERCRKGHKLSE